MKTCGLRELLPRFVRRVREGKKQVLPRHEGVLFEIRLGRKQYSLAETDEIKASRPGAVRTSPKPVSVSVR